MVLICAFYSVYLFGRERGKGGIILQITTGEVEREAVLTGEVVEGLAVLSKDTKGDWRVIIVVGIPEEVVFLRHWTTDIFPEPLSVLDRGDCSCSGVARDGPSGFGDPEGDISRSDRFDVADGLIQSGLECQSGL